MTLPEKEDRHALLRARLHLPMALLGVVWVARKGTKKSIGPEGGEKRP